MVYTVERLEEALRIFREAKSYCDRRGLVTTNLERHLRSTKDITHKNFPRTPLKQVPLWQEDQWSSDDEYGATVSRKKRPREDGSKYKRKRKAEVDIAANGENKKTKRDTAIAEEGPQGKEAYITVKVASPEGKEKLQELAEKYGSGSHKCRNGHDKDEPQGLWRASGGSFQGSLLAPFERTYTMRLDEECRQIDNEDGRALRNRKIPDFKPSLPTCQACKKSTKVYSWRTKGTGLCRRCARQDLVCVQSKKIAASHEISESFRAISDKPAAASPHQTTSTELSSDQGPPQEEVILIESSPDPELGATFIITTHYAHPMNFKYIPKGRAPCDFCSNFKFGVLGWGSVRVEVLQSEDGVYEECGHGHRASHEPTRMCVVCSLDRLMLSRCRRHNLNAIPGVGKMDFQRYMDELHGHGKVPKPSAGSVCSMCPMPAMFRCTAEQKFNRYGQLQLEGCGLHGCGLLACQICGDFLMQNCGILHLPDLRRWRARSGVQLPLRADVEFLVQGSLLHQNFAKK